MTKTIMILAIISVVFVAGMINIPVYAPGPPKVCDLIDDSNCTFNRRWINADSSSDPQNLVNINGSFSRLGLLSQTTTAVQGELQGSLVGTVKTISEDTITTTAGTTTISTTVKAQSRNVNHIEGEIIIDGVVYSAQIKITGYSATQLIVAEKIISTSGTQTSDRTRLNIPIIITMCSDDKCYQGFGDVRREMNTSTVGLTSVTFITDTFDAEVIGEDGLFALKMSRLQRTVATI